jgi:hypothetical protein
MPDIGDAGVDPGIRFLVPLRLGNAGPCRDPADGVAVMRYHVALVRLLDRPAQGRGFGQARQVELCGGEVDGVGRRRETGRKPARKLARKLARRRQEASRPTRLAINPC